jgi:hypothetical protein
MSNNTASTPSAASQDWQEHIGPDEARSHAASAERMVAIQRARDERYGSGRALHRKPTAAFRGFLTVHGVVPAFARHGLFAHAAVYETWVRASNGGMDRASDGVPDIRGLALKVRGVHGASALGEAEAQSQDFLLINHASFAFPTSGEFMDVVAAASEGKVDVLLHLIKRYGFFGAVREAKRAKELFSAPFAGYANAPLFSGAPIACGPYAVRVRLVPAPGNGAPDPQAPRAWGEDVARRLARGALEWSLQLQPFTNERETPIEDASKDWPSPYHTVATLQLPQQARDEAFAEQVERHAFDPWLALAVHRPLGEVMRARKVVYFASQRNRGAV